MSAQLGAVLAGGAGMRVVMPGSTARSVPVHTFVVSSDARVPVSALFNGRTGGNLGSDNLTSDFFS